MVDAMISSAGTEPLAKEIEKRLEKSDLNGPIKEKATKNAEKLTKYINTITINAVESIAGSGCITAVTPASNAILRTSKATDIMRSNLFMTIGSMA